MKIISPNRRRVTVALLLAAGLAGCAVTGEPIAFQAGRDRLDLNAEVDGGTLTARVFVNGQPVIEHRYPPFMNSRDERTARYQGHEIRSVLKIIKGFANTTAQIYVKVDGAQAGEFFF